MSLHPWLVLPDQRLQRDEQRAQTPRQPTKRVTETAPMVKLCPRVASPPRKGVIHRKNHWKEG
jgi:hypothetical protein